MHKFIQRLGIQAGQHKTVDECVPEAFHPYPILFQGAQCLKESVTPCIMGLWEKARLFGNQCVPVWIVFYLFICHVPPIGHSGYSHDMHSVCSVTIAPSPWSSPLTSLFLTLECRHHGDVQCGQSTESLSILPQQRGLHFYLPVSLLSWLVHSVLFHSKTSNHSHTAEG